MTTLPVSGTALAVREPTGAEEIYLVETSLPPLPAFLGLARRVAKTVDGDPFDWTGLPATDLDAAALEIRRAWLGDLLRTDVRCPGADCGERIEVSFSVAGYLRHHQPRRPRGVIPAAADGWFSLAGATVRFRLPTVADLLATAAREGAAGLLAEQCIDAAEVSRALARRLDRALSALAPNLEGFLGGNCPACGRAVSVRFDPLTYTLIELRDAFCGIYLEVHALATAYGWPEEAILALPRSRRRRYASLIADERTAQ